jgi:hypothetical protein
VGIPGSLECAGRSFRSFHFSHGGCGHGFFE